jgi:acetyltransferase-like isoleucine patch superfamily enzyme
MKIIKKTASKIKHFIYPPKLIFLFFTKDIFKDKKFKIGDYTYGKPTVLFENEEANLTIGKFCSIADNVIIFLGGNHRTDWITTYPFNVLKTYFPEGKDIKGHPATKGDVIIGNDVWIGNNVTIMSGVSIGDGAVIAAGSVVSKNIWDYEIWGGNPSRLLKKRFDTETIIKLQNLKWWDWEINKIKSNVETLCSINTDKL